MWCSINFLRGLVQMICGKIVMLGGGRGAIKGYGAKKILLSTSVVFYGTSSLLQH